MLAEFVAGCRDDREPAVMGVDGFRPLEVVDAAYRSIATGQPIRLAAEAARREVGQVP